MTLASFAAMALCLVLDAWHRRPKRGGASAGAGDDAGRMTDPIIRGPDDRVHLGGPTSPAPPPPSSDAGSLAAPLLHRGDSDASPPSRSSSSEPSPYSSSSSLVAKALFDFASLAYRLVPVTALDVLATALVSCALLRLPLSAFLALRHAQLLSAALVKALIRGIRELNPLHKLGASLSLSGAALVVLAVVVDAPEEAPPPLMMRASAATQGLGPAAADDDEGFPDTRASRLVGVALLAASQFTQALQLTFEARFLPGYAFFYEEARAGGGVGAHARRALRRIGAEGVVGCVLCVCVVFPVASFFERRGSKIIPGAGAGEDAWAAWAMVRRTPVLAAFLAAYVLVSAAYAAVGAGVGPFLGVASRGAMETMRFFACWGATLALGAAAADDEGGGRRFERVRARRRASERARVRAPARGVRHGRARDASVRARGRRRAPRRVRAGRASPRGGGEAVRERDRERETTPPGCRRTWERERGVVGAASGGLSRRSRRFVGEPKFVEERRGERFESRRALRSRRNGPERTLRRRRDLGGARSRGRPFGFPHARGRGGGRGRRRGGSFFGAFVGASSRVGAVRDGVSSGLDVVFVLRRRRGGRRGPGPGPGRSRTEGRPGARRRGVRHPGRRGRRRGKEGVTTASGTGLFFLDGTPSSRYK